jgi:hypothetical protein
LLVVQAADDDDDGNGVTLDDEGRSVVERKSETSLF